MAEVDVREEEFLGNVDFRDNLRVKGKLDVNGNVGLAGALDVTGNAALAGDLVVTGDLEVVGTLTYAALDSAPALGAVTYFNTTGTLVTIGSQSDGSTNLVAMAPATALGTDANQFDNGGANDGSLRYTGTPTKVFRILCTFSVKAATAADLFVIAICVDGTAVAASKVLQVGNANFQVGAPGVFVQLAQDQVVTMKIGNLTAGRNATIGSLSVGALAVSTVP